MQRGGAFPKIRILLMQAWMSLKRGCWAQPPPLQIKSYGIPEVQIILSGLQPGSRFSQLQTAASGGSGSCQRKKKRNLLAHEFVVSCPSQRRPGPLLQARHHSTSKYQRDTFNPEDFVDSTAYCKVSRQISGKRRCHQGSLIHA